MPYPENKSENYTNFGGMNEKASQYLLGPNEFINISNFNNEKTGSLTKDYGSTMYIGTTFSTSIYGLYEYNRYFENYATASFIPQLSQLVVTNATAAYGISNGTVNNIYNYLLFAFGQSLLTNGDMDFTTFQNTLYACDGSQFFKYNSVSAYAYSLPELFDSNATSMSQGGSGGLTGYIDVAFALQNNYGLIGPAHFASYLIVGGSGRTTLIFKMGENFNTTQGYSFGPGDYGATYKILWGRMGSGDYTYLDKVPYNQVTYTITADGFTQGGISYAGFTQPQEYIGAWSYRPQGGGIAYNDTPQYLEVFNNQLCMAGLGTEPSNVYISDLGQPEIVQFDSSFEVRTNDGDVIYGMKQFFNQLLIFKSKSFHSLRGDNFSNYVLTQLSAEYGCLSNRAICVWEQNCWFLDSKGICSFNGANVQIVSQKMYETFKNMNIETAKTEAVMIHVKEKYEIWTAIPINGSATNNCIVIYDYVADSWRKREGVQVATLLQTILTSRTSPADRAFSQYQTIYGGYSGIIGLFGSTFYTDGANGMTCIARTRYLNNLGNSVTKQFRRLYLDADVQTGVTLNVGINFYTNQSTMAAYSTTMSLTEFQKRIDFGIPAKDLAVEFVYNDNHPLRINGFTIEYRFQRDT